MEAEYKLLVRGEWVYGPHVVAIAVEHPQVIHPSPVVHEDPLWGGLDQGWGGQACQQAAVAPTDRRAGCDPLLRSIGVHHRSQCRKQLHQHFVFAIQFKPQYGQQ